MHKRWKDHFIKKVGTQITWQSTRYGENIRVDRCSVSGRPLGRMSGKTNGYEANAFHLLCVKTFIEIKKNLLGRAPVGRLKRYRMKYSIVTGIGTGIVSFYMIPSPS